MDSLNFKRINPTSAHTDASFSNQIEFAWTNGSNDILVWDDSYLSVKFNIQYSATTAGPAAAFAVLPPGTGLANVPLHTLFSDCSLRINSKECSRVSDYSQSAYIHQLLSSSAQKQQNNNSANPLTLHRRWAEAGGSTLAQSIDLRNLSVGLNPTATGVQTFTLSGKIPVFLTKEELTGNTSFLLRLVVNPEWRSRFSVTTNPDNIVRAVPINAVAVVSGIGTGVFHVDVKEMTLNLRKYQTNQVPRSITKTFMFSEIFSTTRALDTNGTTQRYNFTMPKTINSVFFCFFDSRESTVGVNSPTQFICEAAKNLVSYEIRYAGTTLPSLKYVLNLQDDPQNNREENNDCYTRFIRDTMDLSPNGSQFSGVEWASQALHYHSLTKLPGSEAPQLDLELNFSGQVANSILYLGAFVPSAVDISYNDTSIVNSIDLYQTSE